MVEQTSSFNLFHTYCQNFIFQAATDLPFLSLKLPSCGIVLLLLQRVVFCRFILILMTSTLDE